MRFDGPWELGAVISGENCVGYEGVEIFGVDKEAVHIEKGSPDCGWRAMRMC